MKDLGKFSIGEYTITKEIWDAVCLWAQEHGYDDLTAGWGKGKKPVGGITWFDAVKFTNALSEMANLSPCYYVDGEIYKNGEAEPTVQDNGGYRLPTAEEWEYACRGGTTTEYFWGDDYIPMPKNEYGWCGVAGVPCLTHEVGLLKPNPYGLYDMAGNVHEWCFDTYKDVFKVMMGGSVAFDSIPKSGFRAFTSPRYNCYETGMRVVSSNPKAADYERMVQNSSHFGEEQELKVKYFNPSCEHLAECLYNELGDSEDAIYVKEAADNPEEMLKRFRDLFVKRLKEYVIKTGIHSSGQDFDAEREEYLKYDFDIRWYGKSGERDSHHLIDKPTYLGLYYAESKDERFLKKCMELYHSMIVRHKAEFDVLDDEMLMQKHQVEQSWAWNNGFESCGRADGILSAFWGAVNAGCDIELLPIDVVAGVALFIMGDNLYTTIKDGRVNIFNQVCHTSEVLMRVSSVYRDFKIAPYAAEVAEERLCEAVNGAVRKDGSPLEQSYMYNMAIPRMHNTARQFISGEKTLKMLKEKVGCVERYILGATIPTGGFPALSTSGSSYPPSIFDAEELKKHKEKEYEYYHTGVWEGVEWKEKDRILNALLKDAEDKPKYKNLHFPYGGITVLRNGWDYNSQMLYFFAAPAGKGHAGYNINEIQLWDYGMPILVSAGGHSYHIKEYYPEDQADIIDDIDDYHHTSLSRNTVTAGKNQKRLLNGENNLIVDMENPCGYHYYESENCVYTEGVYADGYLDSEAKDHRRRIVYDKKNKLIFVLDIMNSECAEEFTQCWHFMPRAVSASGIGFKDQYEMWGYDEQDIKVDAEGRRIYTESKTCPNISLFQFSQNSLSYETKRGELNPAAGWLAPNIQSRRVPKTDIRVKWTAEGISSVLTVIETSYGEERTVKNIEKTPSGCEITTASGEKIIFNHTQNGSFEYISETDKLSVGMEGKNYAVENGVTHDIKAATGLIWEEKDGYSMPKYVY